MDRRQYLTTLAGMGAVATAGCSSIGGSTVLSDPAVHVESTGRKSLRWSSENGKVASLGVDGTVSSGVVSLGTELWHREGTRVESLRLRVWMPTEGGEASAQVALVSPVEGDSSAPPSIHLYSPRRGLGTVVAVDDFDDLADETIATIDFLVRPIETARRVAIDATISLAGAGALGTDYELDGRLELAYPALESE